MAKEGEEAGENALEDLKQRVFASAFGSFDPRSALSQYHEVFEKPDEQPEYDVEEFEPETEADVQEMMNAARRAGIIG